MLIIKRRKKAVLTLALLAVLVGGGAYAYFTATGTGSGSGTVGSASALTVTGTVSGSLYPGATVSNNVSFTVTNPSSGHQHLGTITLSGVHACTGTGSSWDGTACTNSGTRESTCETFDNNASSTADDFSMQAVSANQDVAPGSSAVTATGTFTMNDLASAQDSCQGTNLTLSFTLS
jgi:hypothetical protein